MTDREEETPRAPITGGPRDRAVRCALWLLGTCVVTVAVWPTMSVPVQADDMLTLFNLGPTGGGLLHLSTSTFDRSLSSFVDGETSHFFPLGLTLEVTLKGVMLRASAHGATASGVHHAFFLLVAIGTFVSSTSLVAAAVRRDRPSRLGVAGFAVPVALGFAAAVQVTTLWSTYDPLVVHPVFGGFVTLVGVTYLMLLTHALQPHRRRATVLACGLLSVVGVGVYEGFYAYLAVAALMVLARIVLGARDRRRALVWVGLWTVGPAVPVILVTRLWSAHASVSTYRGTEVDLGLGSLESWLSSMQTTLPASTWALNLRSVPGSGLDVSPLALLGLTAGLAAIATWLVAARRSAATVATVEHGDDGKHGERGAERSAASLEWLVPVVGMLTLGPLVFAVSAQWSAYLLVDGMTYMSATTSYWAWAMVIGVALQRLVTTRSRLLLGGVLAVVLGFTGAQQVLNESEVAAEVEHPTPFGVDLVKILDDGTPLDEAGRCALLAGVPQSQQIPGWIDTLNREYASRHGVAFCRR